MISRSTTEISINMLKKTNIMYSIRMDKLVNLGTCDKVTGLKKIRSKTKVLSHLTCTPEHDILYLSCVVTDV